MLSQSIPGATRRIAESQEEYHALVIKDQVTDDGTKYMESWWQPTPKELNDLLNGGCVRLGILGSIHPPVFLTTSEPPSLAEESYEEAP